MKTNGDVRVSFGTPGAGKTQSILDHLKSIAGSGASPDSVLVLVPNRQSATLLRDQVLLETGWAANRDVVRTLQGLAFEICTAYAAARSLPDPRLLTGAAQAALLQEILQSEFGRSLRSEWSLPTATLELPSFISELRDLISICQQHNTDPGLIIEIGRSGRRGALVAAGRLLGEYRQQLAARSLIDPQQLIAEAERCIQDAPELRPAVSWLFVDDAHEFSTSELRLIQVLCGAAKLYAYADPDATVLGFRAAAPEELVRVLASGRDFDRFDIPATASRPRQLAELMDRVAQRIPTALGGTHRASLKQRFSDSQADPVLVEIFDSVAAEGDYLADFIRRERISNRRKWSDIAVVVRTRSQVDQLSQVLSQHGIPVRLPKAQSALSGFGVAGELLKLILRAEDLEIQTRDSLDQLLAIRLSQLDAIDVRSLKRRLATSSSGLLPAFAELLFADGFADLKGHAVTKARKFGALLQLAATADQKKPHQMISEIWQHLGIEARLATDAKVLSEVGFAAQRDLDSMVELTNSAVRFSEQQPQASALDFAIHESALLIPEDSLAQPSRLDAVQILTPASLLSKRFPVVVLPRLQEGIWPNLRPRNSLLAAASIEAYLRGTSDDPLAPTRAELQHELRMFYKAIGAADSAILLTAVQQEDESPSQFLNLLAVELDTPRSYRREHDIRARVAKLRLEFAKTSDSKVAAKLAAYAHVGAPGAHPQLWYGTKPYSSNQQIAQPEAGPNVSPSQLEKFSHCPLHWFIATYGGEGKGFEASVGTLLHEALEIGGTSFEQLWSVVDSKWGELNSSSEWQNLAERRKAIKMVQAIASYLSEIDQKAISSLEREKFISANLEGLQIRGTIDRIEQLPDGRLRVVDLKTGQVGTKAEVAENLQLALYQMLVEVAYPESSIAGAMIVSVKGGKLSQIEQPPLSADLRARISGLFQRAHQEFPGPTFQASVAEHCSSPGAICSTLLAPEVITG